MIATPLWAYTEANNDRPARTIEETFKFHAAYADIYDFEFGTFLSGFASDLVDLPGGSDTWTDGEVHLEATGTTGLWLPRWFQLSDYDDLPLNTIIEFDTGPDSNCGGVILRKKFAVYWNESAIGGLHYTTQTTLVERPIGFTGQHHFRIAIKEMQVTSLETDWRVFVSVWVDDAWQLTYSYVLSQPGLTDKDIALLVYDDTGYVAEYDDLVIGELSKPVEWEILDIGSPPQEGLSRVLDGRYVRWFIRYDGTLKAWQPKASMAVATYVDDDLIEDSRTRDFRVAINHNRQIGGWYETDYLSAEWYNKLGHKFGYNNNPVIDTEPETWEASERVVNESLEQFKVAEFTVAGNPLLEPQDHIEVDGDDWIIDNISHEVGQGEFLTHLSCRSYINVS